MFLSPFPLHTKVGNYSSIGNQLSRGGPALTIASEYLCGLVPLLSFHSGPARSDLVAASLRLRCLRESMPHDPSEGIGVSSALQRRN